MRLITLNTWGGKIYKPMMGFINKHSQNTDIFCLQEIFNSDSVRSELDDVRPRIFEELKKELPDFNGYFVESQYNDEGQAIFVKKDLAVNNHGDIFVFLHRHSNFGGDGRTMGRNLQYIEIEKGGKLYTIANFHGLWNGHGKTDTPDRLQQSRNIMAFLNQAKGAKVLAGDFNLEPDTESVAILENGMTNLIKENEITSTRSKFYEKDCKFADYTFVSLDIQVEKFEVLQDPVSDHLPMLLDFS